MNESQSNLLLIGLTSGIGLLVGFWGNYFIAKFNARNEQKKSIAGKRAEMYIMLWELCDKQIDTRKEQKDRLLKLHDWYLKGGGLLLPFQATDRLAGAMRKLEVSKEKELDERELSSLKQDLSWLRTEMKYEVGSYTRKEANKVLPNTRIS